MRRALVFALGIAVLAWAAWRWMRQEPPPPALTGVDSVNAGVHSVQLWFGAPRGDSLIREPRDVVEAGALHERVSGLVAELARGPGKRGVATLPAGTAVLHVHLDERGLLVVDLSRAFQQNFRGGSGAEYLAISSLVRTLGANLPEVKQVQIACGGATIPTLGGHLPLDRPLDVSEWP